MRHDDLQRARRERAEFLADAATLFQRVKHEGRVTVNRFGETRWDDFREEQRWAHIHSAADAAVKRYYDRQRGPF